MRLISSYHFIRAHPLAIITQGLLADINTSIWCCLASSAQSLNGSFDRCYSCLIILTVQTFGPVTQSSFLQQMGIDTRMKVSNVLRPQARLREKVAQGIRRGKRRAVLFSILRLPLSEGGGGMAGAWSRVCVL